MVLNQLLCGGVMEVIKIRQMGYPFRETWESLWRIFVEKRFHAILGLSETSDPEGACRRILGAVLKPGSGAWQVSSKTGTVFLKQDAFLKLQDWRKGETTLDSDACSERPLPFFTAEDDDHPVGRARASSGEAHYGIGNAGFAAIKIQKRYRGWRARRAAKRMLQAARRIKRALRTHVLRQKFKHQMEQIERIQGAVRKHLRRQRFRRVRAAKYGTGTGAGTVRILLTPDREHERKHTGLYGTFIIRARVTIVIAGTGSGVHSRDPCFLCIRSFIIHGERHLPLFRDSWVQPSPIHRFVQKVYRRFRCMVAYHKRRHRHRAAVRIQRWHLRRVRPRIRRKLRACRKLQRWWRRVICHLHRRRLRSAIKVQAHWRRFRKWRWFQKVLSSYRKSADSVGRFYKTIRTRRWFRVVRTMAVRIQRAWRAHRSRIFILARVMANQVRRERERQQKARAFMASWLAAHLRSRRLRDWVLDAYAAASGGSARELTALLDCKREKYAVFKVLPAPDLAAIRVPFGEYHLL
jgi:hypothetical protein